MPKEIKEDLDKWRVILSSWIGGLDIIIMFLPKCIYRFRAIPVKILADCFCIIHKLLLQFTWKCKGPRAAKTILKNKNQFGGFIVFNFKIVTPQVIKTTYQFKNRQIE